MSFRSSDRGNITIIVYIDCCVIIVDDTLCQIKLVTLITCSNIRNVVPVSLCCVNLCIIR